MHVEGQVSDDASVGYTTIPLLMLMIDYGKILTNTSINTPIGSLHQTAANGDRKSIYANNLTILSAHPPLHPSYVMRNKHVA